MPLGVYLGNESPWGLFFNWKYSNIEVDAIHRKMYKITPLEWKYEVIIFNIEHFRFWVNFRGYFEETIPFCGSSKILEQRTP